MLTKRSELGETGKKKKKSVREGGEKMVVFTKGKSHDDFSFVFCSVEPHFLTMRNLKATLTIPGKSKVICWNYIEKERWILYLEGQRNFT